MNQDKNTPCPLCGGNAICTFQGMSGYIEGTKYDVFECTNCLTSFVSPMSNLKDQYEIVYGGDSTKDSSTDYYHYLAYGTKQLKNPLKDLSNFTAIFWAVKKAIDDSGIKPGAKVLEIGCGLGYFTYALNKAGYDCEGFDFSDTAIHFANDFFGKKYSQGTIESFSQNHANTYDLVIATEVIEHIVDPNSFIEHSLKVLKPGGTLILTTPIKDIHPKGTIWATEPAPIHLWWFTEKGIASIAEHLHTQASFVDFTEYTKHKIWTVYLGTPNTAPDVGPIVDREGHFLHKKTKGLKERFMRIVPAWLYIKLVCVYHDLKFLQRNKPRSKYMYGMCAVISKSV